MTVSDAATILTLDEFAAYYSACEPAKDFPELPEGQYRLGATIIHCLDHPDDGPVTASPLEGSQHVMIQGGHDLHFGV